MQSLLPYYERELALLAQQSGDFARHYPRIAGRLIAPQDAPQDPHTQRLVQAFAQLTARSHKRLDDDVPLFVESLLELLYPQVLRPFPACSIAQFALGEALDGLAHSQPVPRGTLLDARPTRGVACRFATTAPAQLLPLRVLGASFRTGAYLPAGAPLPEGATALLSLRLALAGAANFATGCVPVINLFPRQAEPIRLTHTRATYTVLPDARAAASHEVYAIDQVNMVRRTAQGQTVVPLLPLYGLRHAALLREGDGPRAHWWTQRSDAIAERCPGHEVEIGLADPQRDPMAEQAETLSIALHATHRDLPCRLSIGNPGGDLWLAANDAPGQRWGGGSPVWHEIRLLRKPTPPRRVDLRREGPWRLVSLLSLQRQGFSIGGLQALRALLRLHDLPRGAAARQLMAGLTALELRDAHAAVPGHPYAGTVRGTDVRLSVDEAHFTGNGLFLFAQVLARALGQQAPLNSFTRLSLLSARTGAVLVACAPRSGDEELA